MKKYSKYDYIVIQTKMGAITSIFAFSMISALFFLVGLIGITKGFQDNITLNAPSVITWIVFVLNIPMLLSSIKKYGMLRRKIRELSPEEIEKDPSFRVVIYTKKQLILISVLFGVLAIALLGAVGLLSWVLTFDFSIMVLLMSIVFGVLAILLLAMIITYIRLIPVAESIEKTK